MATPWTDFVRGFGSRREGGWLGRGPCRLFGGVNGGGRGRTMRTVTRTVSHSEPIASFPGRLAPNLVP